ncbi:hypothetical protein ACEWY4_010499 [Coilia grayii]|uniref:Uncharacterized protein n=1 Tax=Coilia grayii TaxID=363190 RepID=A0ABD1K234_9TELE
MDEGGWCYIAYCNTSCQVERETRPCNFTTLPPSSTPSKSCIDVEPPRKNGDTWTGNCTTYTCVNGKVSSQKVPCSPEDPQQPQCENGYSPIKVYTNNHCCYHYECQCKCKGWGDKHHHTFDGNYYSFQGNCTYVLVQEIIPKYNFSVHIKKSNCDTSACWQSLTIKYKSEEVLLEQRHSSLNLAFVNGRRVFPTFKNDHFTIISTGMELQMAIPDINTTLMFGGSSFSITLSASHFNGNTEGQCGNCDNNGNNDCKLPNGQIQPKCTDTAKEWVVNASECVQPTGQPPTTPPPTCKSDICDVILSKIFEECRKHLLYKYYYDTCKADACGGGGNKSACLTVQTFARDCSQESHCVEWRTATNGQCEVDCRDKVYEACGSPKQPTCISRSTDVCEKQPECTDEKELGCSKDEVCRCPEGQILFSPYSDTCVPNCNVCLGPDGMPKMPGEKWRHGCKECECSWASFTTECWPVECKAETITCPVGQMIVSKAGDCCVKNECEPKDVCVYNNTERQPGEQWSPFNDRCQKYECVKENDQFVIQKVITSCPRINTDECIPGTVRTDESGCCKVCTPKSCKVSKKQAFLETSDCNSTAPVELTSCVGACATSSMYSLQMNTVMHNCACCREQRTSQRQTEIHCTNGTTLTHSYVYIEACGCESEQCKEGNIS